MDKFGYEFIIMMKGMKPLAEELVLEKDGHTREYYPLNTTFRNFFTEDVVIG